MSSAKRHVYWDLSLQLRTWKFKITSVDLQIPITRNVDGQWINIQDNFIKALWFIKFQNTILKLEAAKLFCLILKLLSLSRRALWIFCLLYSFRKGGSGVVRILVIWVTQKRVSKLFPYLFTYALFVTIYGHVACCPWWFHIWICRLAFILFLELSEYIIGWLITTIFCESDVSLFGAKIFSSKS